MIPSQEILNFRSQDINLVSHLDGFSFKPTNVFGPSTWMNDFQCREDKTVILLPGVITHFSVGLSTDVIDLLSPQLDSPLDYPWTQEDL